MKQVREHRDDLVARLPRLQIVFVAALVVVASTYWFVQVVQGDRYREQADNNRLRKVPIRAPRGLIHDRHGRLLVENVPSYNLLLDRSRSADVGRALEFAAGILERPAAELAAVVERSRGASPFTPLLVAERLSLSQVARFEVSALEYPEFEVDVGHLRLYRQGPLIANSVGHLGEVTTDDLSRPGSPYRGGDLVGKKGVEESFDHLLRGEDGERVVIVDSRGLVREESGQVAARPGASLTLALDLELQQEAARFLEGKVGAAVALDPVTGEVLVLVSSPTYDPNLFARRLHPADWEELRDAAHHPLQNRAIQSAYAPGSVFKIVLAVAGLTERVIGPHEVVYCPGSTRIYNRRFRCWKRNGHGWVNLHQAIKESCDVFFYYLGQKLGITRIAQYARRLGLGEATGFDIAGEKSGLVPDPEWSLRRRGSPWYPGETISVAIGQGPLLATPLQLASMMATVAGGQRLAPHLRKTDSPPPPAPTDLDPKVLEAVRHALWAVVNDGGTGGTARVPGVEVAGKTGTVQVVQQKTWMDNEELPFEKRDHAWFASFASAGDRQLVVVVFVEHGGKGSRAAAPLAKILYETYYRDLLGPRRAT